MVTTPPCAPHAKIGMDRSINWPDPEVFKSLGWKAMFGKEMVAQVAGSINICGIIDMTIGINV